MVLWIRFIVLMGLKTYKSIGFQISDVLTYLINFIASFNFQDSPNHILMMLQKNPLYKVWQEVQR